MNKIRPVVKTLLTGIFFIMIVHGCKPLIATYDQYAYTQTTSLKVDVLNLMDKATELYADHSKDVEDVNTELMKNIEYEKHREKNQITIAMYNILWKLLNDSTTITVGTTKFKHGFFEEWKRRKMLQNNGKPDVAFIEEAKTQIGEGFDMIAELESRKIKPSDSNVQSFLSRNK